GFRAGDGWFIIQVGREHQFAKLADLVGHPEWPSDARFATRQGWLEHLDDVLRPAIEGWAASQTRLEVCDALGRAGIAAGPCFTAEAAARRRGPQGRPAWGESTPVVSSTASRALLRLAAW